MELDKARASAQKILESKLPAGDNDFPGCQYCIVSPDETLFSTSIGYSDMANKTAMSDTTWMNMFSMTKTFTAVAILKLWDESNLDIDDAVSKYIDHPYGQEMTVAQLLSHCGGCPNPIPLKWVHSPEENKNWDSIRALKKALDEHKGHDAPNSKCGYSNVGYWLAEAVIEKASGMKYGDYVASMLAPIYEHEHSDSTCPTAVAPTPYPPSSVEFSKPYIYRWSPLRVAGLFFGMSLGDHEGSSWVALPHVHVDGPGYGGLCGTAAAVSKFVQCLIPPCDNNKILSPKAMDKLYEQARLNNGEWAPMTFGWHLDTALKPKHGVVASGELYSKPGGGAGFIVEMRVGLFHSLTIKKIVKNCDGVS